VLAEPRQIPVAGGKPGFHLSASACLEILRRRELRLRHSFSAWLRRDDQQVTANSSAAKKGPGSGNKTKQS
jgi:hypothetical protein